MRRSLDALETSFAAATTIGARMPILFDALATGSPKAIAEANRMISEKTEAAALATVAAASAWTGFWMRAGLGLIAPGQVGREAERIMDAAHAPGRRAVRANARRLAKPKRRRAKA